ncbi:Ig-like domain-containing protein [Myxococcus sp. MISCRS1]|uniref:Ig-like domain-containing protein n=1 Tax=Myxococcus sp. MISCRS1 TaxID=2996786 RepID=UPI00226D88BA|nr:Ig-like domain-containing protein [Myxococcus sp. MISCRS1]MCY0997876.1 Ig-like domain-containing protein [Myxococcus sp. MISCRS1]
MHPTRPAWVLPLLFMALGTTACGTLKSEPTPPAVREEEPPPESELRVTVQTEGPSLCGEGPWRLSVLVEGGTPERVELLMDAREPLVLEPPYQHVVDCATHAEGSFTFVARAVGGERNFESESVSVTVDRTPPSIVAWYPRQSHPSVTSPITVVFSEPLLPGSLQASSTRLRDENGFSVAHQAVLSEDGTTLALVPKSPLLPPVTLHAELLQRTLTDRAGNPLDPSQATVSHTYESTYWPFTDGTEPLSSNFARFPTSLALTQERHGTSPVVGYIDLASTTQEPSVARWDGQAWQLLPPLRAENARSRPARNLTVAAKQGELVAAWDERDEKTGIYQLHVASHEETGWRHLGEPYDTQARYVRFTMAVDPSGRHVIAWEGMPTETDKEVRVIRWNGTQWLPLGEALSANPAPGSWSHEPAIALDDEVLVSWLEASADTGATHLHVRTYLAGGWTPVGASIPIPEGAVAERTGIAFERYGGAVLAWAEHRPSTSVSTLRLSSIDNVNRGSDWSTPEAVEVLSTTTTFESFRLVIDRHDEPWLAWTEYPSGEGPQSYYRRRRAKVWEPKQLISPAELSAFLVDENAFPWALAGMTVVRPQ